MGIYRWMVSDSPWSFCAGWDLRHTGLLCLACSCLPSALCPHVGVWAFSAGNTRWRQTTIYQTPSHASLCIKEVLDGKKLSLRCHSQLSLLRLSHAYEETMAISHSQRGEYEPSATQLHVTLESVCPVWYLTSCQSWQGTIFLAMHVELWHLLALNVRDS